MKRIAVVSFARKKSLRCPNKMLRPFGGTTLTDIVLSKVKEFGADGYFAGFEPEFKEKCLEHGVNFIQRDKRSATIDGPIIDIFGFVRTLEYKKILFISGCNPFLSIKTITEFYQSCLENYDKSLLAVLKRKNYFFSVDKKPLNFEPATDKWNTKTVTPIFESANVLYFYDKSYFLTNGFFWSWDTVELVDFEPSREFIDIDTEEDFIRAEFIWKIGGHEA